MVGLAQNQLVLVIVSSLQIVCALFFLIHTRLTTDSIKVKMFAAIGLSMTKVFATKKKRIVPILLSLPQKNDFFDFFIVPVFSTYS